MPAARPLSAFELEAGLAEVRQSPADAGRVELIVRRPRPGEREIVTEAELDLVVGLVGDNWKTRRMSVDRGRGIASRYATHADERPRDCLDCRAERPLAIGRRSTVRRPRS